MGYASIMKGYATYYGSQLEDRPFSTRSSHGRLSGSRSKPPSYGREAGRPAPRHSRTVRETFASHGSSV